MHLSKASRDCAGRAATATTRDHMPESSVLAQWGKCGQRAHTALIAAAAFVGAAFVGAVVVGEMHRSRELTALRPPAATGGLCCYGPARPMRHAKLLTPALCERGRGQLPAWARGVHHAAVPRRAGRRHRVALGEPMQGQNIRRGAMCCGYTYEPDPRHLLASQAQ